MEVAPIEGGHDRSWLMIVSRWPLLTRRCLKCAGKGAAAMGGAVGAATGGTGGCGDGTGASEAMVSAGEGEEAVEGGRAKRLMARLRSKAGPWLFEGTAVCC